MWFGQCGCLWGQQLGQARLEAYPWTASQNRDKVMPVPQELHDLF